MKIKNLDLEIILPVYNEKKSIEAVLKEWVEDLPKKLKYKFIICEDGSTDGTTQLLKKLQKKYKFILDHKNGRRGYGNAVIDGIKRSSANYILCVDSDGQCDPTDFDKFWKKRSPEQVLIGRRKERQDSFQRKMFSQSFKFYFDFLFPSKIQDPSTPYVLFQKKLIELYIDDLKFMKEGFWWGFVGMCVKRKVRILELPINHRERIDGETNVYKTGKIPKIAAQNALGLVKLKLSR